MIISGVYSCPFCGATKDFGENFELPPAPYKIPCDKCGGPVIQSVPEDFMDAWAEKIEKSLTDEEKKLLGRE